MATTLAERIQWILDTRGWSQSELARRAGLAARSHIERIMKTADREQAKGPTAAVLAKIARAADVELLWLTTDEGPRERVRLTIHPAIARVAASVEGATAEAQLRASSVVQSLGADVEIDDDRARTILREAVANLERERVLAAAVLSASSR